MLSLLVFFALIPFVMTAQDFDDFRILDTIEVANGSFEQFDSKEKRVLRYWKDCGDPERTPPSIFRNGDPLLLPDESAADGEHFLTLVTRDDSSWEAIGQELKEPLEAGKNYVLKCYLRKSYLESEADLLAQKETVEGPVVF
jgi:hypothetical protein